jgi:hypothetical protein
MIQKQYVNLNPALQPPDFRAMIIPHAMLLSMGIIVSYGYGWSV